MAIFEPSRQQKNILDDSICLKVTVESSQEVHGHTEYLLRVQRGPNKENSWKVLRRYNDFAELHKFLSISGIELPMPGKKFFGNMRPDFIAKRREALQNYINTVLMNPILASSLTTKRFVDPDSYSQSFHDQAVQNASLCLRNEGSSCHWALGTTLGAIGWRLRKHYFKVTTKPPDKASKQLVKSGSQSHQSKHLATASNNGGGSLDTGNVDATELVLEWLEYGPDKYVDEKEMSGILKSLIGLQHPYIEPIVFMAHNENGGLVIRKFYKHGTLKDKLCMATPKNPFLSKYGNPKGRTALTMKQVATYGRQILEALIFLHSKGYPYGHLHSGNIVITDEGVKLLDIENFLFGVPSFYRPFFVQHSKIHSSETIDVFCFGHVLFEMSMGYPLQESVVRQITEFPEALKNLLESILSKEACRAGLPTLEQLINHEFFIQHASLTTETTTAAASSSTAAAGASAETESTTKPHFKLSLNAKELLKQAVAKVDNRLRDEQKSVKNQKRIVRVQELMSSEEEKRKTKQKAKLEHRQSKLKQQVSLQANNGRLSLCSTSMGGSTSGTTTTITTTASSSSAEASGATKNPLMRADSVVGDDVGAGGGGATYSGIKSPPPTPSTHQQQQHQLHQQQSQHHHHHHHHYHHYQQQSQQQQQQLKQKSTSSTIHTVERQSSSPNISTVEAVIQDEDNGSSEPTRSALLESICKFNRGSLRKVRSND